MTGPVVVDFCGEEYAVPPDRTLVIGREGDVVVDDNPFLHRRFLELAQAQGMWWLTNIGSHLSATVTDPSGGMQAWLAPGARMPVVFERTVVWFSAGQTTYEFDIRLEGAMFEPTHVVDLPAGQTTIGRVSMTPDQRLLLVALCERALRRGEPGASSVPQSSEAAARLGWTLTRFNRKLDNVCQKLTTAGVRGLHGSTDRLASSRRARLVEYSLATRLVTRDDLALLPPAR